MTETNFTRYERARIIGARALQISMGAPVLIETDKKEPIDIALAELEKEVIPITVKRTVEQEKGVVPTLETHLTLAEEE
ncbi:DNA-directed RNA polymerase, subunit K/omega [Candidatus Methanoperedens nitroreducens]|uniref:DNA-directed RNA polymerase subunit Rpo6 n=1 Tax=Candidatus Methanoperedens nitratireducens TaxID=1392998 RepID=A0A062UYR0_9EURY|nr:DNA-directed RNA polymerase subunit K [Candidatus Methanoperedens nitroreducens]KCZ72066.1 DNA-directed RNA polymerase, subunit K/omega [Candidatus Methanoperedens nitroreducens]MDJ1421959.1 DNA-directed RNA polymerase subunit K [Candidatus Methanoperedens sp.]